MGNCKTCKKNTIEASSIPESVPYIAHEADMARMERTNKRIWIALITVIILLFASNLAWVVYESQWEVFETTVEAEQQTDGGGNNYALGGDMYGEAKS